MQRWIWITVMLAPFIRAEARVYSPRVLSPHNADTYSLKTFAEFHRWRDLSGDAKVFEIFKYLADTRTGIYPLGVPAWEGEEEFSEYGAVRDPIKMLNVYPIGHCGTLGPTMAGIMEGMGMGRARTLILPAWNHVASEVLYDGRWHYLDLDVRAVFRRADGSLASMQEGKTRSCGTGPTARFLPLDPLPTCAEVHENARAPLLRLLQRRAYDGLCPSAGRDLHAGGNRKADGGTIIELRAKPFRKPHRTRAARPKGKHQLHGPQPRQRPIRLSAQSDGEVVGFEMACTTPQTSDSVRPV